jgi:hypothetical protein
MKVIYKCRSCQQASRERWRERGMLAAAKINEAVMTKVFNATPADARHKEWLKVFADADQEIRQLAVFGIDSDLDGEQ